MKKLFVLFCLLCIYFVALSAEKEIVLNTPTGDLYGSILTPDNDNKDVIAILICGSGPTDRDGNNPQMKNNSIRYLAEDLCSAGIASVRYDKRAIAASAKAATSEVDLRFTNYVDDASAWIDMLCKDYKKVIVIGHSEGSLIGIMASVDNPQVKGVISVAGVGHSAAALLKEQLASQAAEITDVAFPIINDLKNGKTVDNVPQMLYALFRPSVQPYLISWFAVEPAVEIAKITVPVLILQGDKDIQVSGEDARLLHEARPKSEKVIIADMNHVLKSCNTTDIIVQSQTYINPDSRNAQQLAETIVKFIKGI